MTDTEIEKAWGLGEEDVSAAWVGGAQRARLIDVASPFSGRPEDRLTQVLMGLRLIVRELDAVAADVPPAVAARARRLAQWIGSATVAEFRQVLADQSTDDENAGTGDR